MINNLQDCKDERDVASFLGIRYSQLTFHARRNAGAYQTWNIPKKNGGIRQITAPISALKLIQRKLAECLLEIYPVRKHVHGFVPDKDILSNARVHLRKRWVLNIDLADFFYSINFGRVRGVLLMHPFNFNEEVSTLIAQLTTHNNVLPQGAPTSPVLSNIVAYRLDSTLARMAASLRLSYSRYADDITFSANSEFPPVELYRTDGDGNWIPGQMLENAISSNGFIINLSKVRLAVNNQRKEVTGITVNLKPNVRRTYIRHIRSMLHAWEKFGEQKAERHHLENHGIRKHRHPDLPTPSFRFILLGKIMFIGYIKGYNDACYNNFISRYCAISGMSPPLKTAKQKLPECVFVIESERACEQGTAFLLGDEGLITCYHCCHTNGTSLPDLVAFKPGARGHAVPVAVTRAFPVSDLAILSTPDPTAPRLERGSSNAVKQGDELLIAGYPNHRDGDSLMVVRVNVVGFRECDNLRNILVSGGIVTGMSGGVALNSRMEVIGVLARGGATFNESLHTEDNRIVPIEALFHDL